MHQERCRGRSEGRGLENQREFWVTTNRTNDDWISRELPPHAVIIGWSNENIRRRLNGDRERRHEEFLMNLEQVKELPNVAIENGE